MNHENAYSLDYELVGNVSHQIHANQFLIRCVHCTECVVIVLLCWRSKAFSGNLIKLKHATTLKFTQLKYVDASLRIICRFELQELEAPKIKRLDWMKRLQIPPQVGKIPFEWYFYCLWLSIMFININDIISTNNITNNDINNTTRSKHLSLMLPIKQVTAS